MERVKESLKILIQGESDGVSQYKKFSEVAEKEGYNNLSILFEALSIAEGIHLKNHTRALGEDFTVEPYDAGNTGTTIENLANAIKAESHEGKYLYSKLMKNIKNETNTEYGKVANLTMLWAKKVEKEHARILKKALKSLKNGSDFMFDTVSVCQVCGNIVLDKNDDKVCDICGHDDIFFKCINKVR